MPNSTTTKKRLNSCNMCNLYTPISFKNFIYLRDQVPLCWVTPNPACNSWFWAEVDSQELNPVSCKYPSLSHHLLDPQGLLGQEAWYWAQALRCRTQLGAFIGILNKCLLPILPVDYGNRWILTSSQFCAICFFSTTWDCVLVINFPFLLGG